MVNKFQIKYLIMFLRISHQKRQMLLLETLVFNILHQMPLEVKPYQETLVQYLELIFMGQRFKIVIQLYMLMTCLYQ